MFNKLVPIFFLAILWGACNQTNPDEQDVLETTDLSVIEFDEDNIIAACLAKINVPLSDATVSLKRAHLNDDEFLDAYISVNLAKRAQQDFENSSNPAMFEDLGFLGNYNYLFVWDGETKKIGRPYLIASNALEELSVEEHHLLDPGYKTLSAIYRVRSSVFEIFFRYLNGNIIPVFSYKIMDEIGTNNPEAFVKKIVDNPTQIQRDIIIYEASIPGYSPEKAIQNRNYYPYDNLEAKPVVVNRFFFEKTLGKYATESF